MGLMIAAVAVIGTSTAIPMSFADKPESNQDGWGEVTSETATSDNDNDGRSDGLGRHSSDPSNDGVGNDDDGTSDDGDPLNDDNVENHDPRAGIGNVAESFTGEKNPNKLGCTLAGIDENPDTSC